MIFSNINVNLFRSFNSLAGENIILDKIMIFTARYLIYTVPIYLLYLWFLSKNDKEKKASLYIFLAIIISLSIGRMIGLFYYHPRPFMMGLGKELFPHSRETSFPSDHATVMFAVSSALFFLKDTKNGIVFFLLSLLVGFARIFCGVHFPFDIVGALIVSLVGTSIVFMFKKYLDYLFAKAIYAYDKIISIIFKRKLQLHS